MDLLRNLWGLTNGLNSKFTIEQSNHNYSRCRKLPQSGSVKGNEP